MVNVIIDDGADHNELYIKQRKIGEGTYAVVYKGIDTKTKKDVAIKKIRLGQLRDGINFSAIREIKVLQELRHPNIVELVDVFPHKTNINLILEYLEGDLEMLIRDRALIFTAADIKAWMLMTVRAVEFCHRHWILHRDLKPNNLLISKNGVLKLADFGLAKSFGSPKRNFTSQVCTRWYRSPELLLGATHYGEAVDMWSVGCVFAELMLRIPYFAGDSDLEQLNLIFRARGTPSENEWPGILSLANQIEFPKHTKPPIKHLFTAASEDSLDLLEKLLIFAPSDRCTATQALLHRYFAIEPAPSLPEQLPKCTKVIPTADKSTHP